MENFSPAPKPKKKRKGRSVKRDKSVAEAARRRDGVCLYGMLYRDGCVTGYSPHHIVSFGSDPRMDVLENLICLCHKHHRMAEEHHIAPITLQGILYHFYGYGPIEEVVDRLNDMRKSASDYGLTAVFELDNEYVLFRAIGFVSRFTKSYSWDEVLSPGFMTLFDADLSDSQRKRDYE